MNAKEWREQQVQSKIALEKAKACRPMYCDEIEEYEPKKPPKEANMAYNNIANAVIANTNTLAPEKQYLVDRAATVKSKRVWEELREKFYIDQYDPFPKTYKELRERLESGKFTLPKDDPEYSHRSVDLNYLKFKDPNKKPDIEGYEKACEVLNKLYAETLDTIHVKSLDDGLAAIKKLETEKIH